MDKKRTRKKEKKIISSQKELIKAFEPKKKKYFHEAWAEEEELLSIGLAESRRAKQERIDREKSESQKLQEELEPIDG
ncbi:MAG: hypothetical protein CBD99_001590 [Candidatus Pelagibacter sp. TMED239]|nr:MAG: hypothetical protein CBD99_001590 [Candidatus Pelagibacter sp. TMED239]|tara:strand:- start:499 stop:732 length:234 start_codon:yes stop_codon:yes gene_type:complete